MEPGLLIGLIFLCCLSIILLIGIILRILVMKGVTDLDENSIILISGAGILLIPFFIFLLPLLLMLWIILKYIPNKITGYKSENFRRQKTGF